MEINITDLWAQIVSVSLSNFTSYSIQDIFILITFNLFHFHYAIKIIISHHSLIKTRDMSIYRFLKFIYRVWVTHYWILKIFIPLLISVTQLINLKNNCLIKRENTPESRSNLKMCLGLFSSKGNKMLHLVRWFWQSKCLKINWKTATAVYWKSNFIKILQHVSDWGLAELY